MRILCYNIQACCNSRNYTFWDYLKSKPKVMEQIVDNIKELNPDVVGLMEVDTGSFRSIDQAAYIAKRLGYNYASACKYGFAAKLPIFCHQHTAIFSKYPILEVKKHKFSKGFKRLALEARLKTEKGRVSVIAAHLSLGKETRKTQLNELEEIVEHIGGKCIVMGDFNGENIRLKMHTNASWSKKRDYCASGKTFPSWHPEKGIDYIFSTSRIKSSEILDWQISDHLPVYAEIN